MFHSRFHPMTFAAAAAVLALLAPAVACAYDFRLTPSVEVREEYNSNLYFDRDDEKDNWLTTVSPGLALEWKTERLDATLTGNVSRRFYSEDSILDATDSAVRGRMTYSLTPEFRVTARGQYRAETRPDRYFEETGLAVDTVRDYRHNYDVAADWAVTDLSSVMLFYGFDRVNYPDDLRQDYDIHSAGLGFVHDLSRLLDRTQGRMNFGFRRGEYDAIRIDSGSATVGISRSIHELWSVMVNGGGMYIRSEFDDWQGQQKGTDHTGWTGDASLAYKGETAEAALTFVHGLYPAYGYTGATIRTATILNLERRFVHDISATFSTGYYINRSDAGEYSTQDIDNRSFRVRPGLRWKASKYFSIEASYQYRHIDYRISGESAFQQVVFAGVNLSCPLFDE